MELETRHLQIKNANKDISLAKSKAENNIKSKKIRSLESMIKILEAELENIKSKLKSKVSKLECLKSEAISNSVLNRNDEKNITKFNDISAVIEPSKSLRQYFIHRKNIDQAKKIDTKCLESETHSFTTNTSFIIILNNTNNEKTPISEESVIQDYY
ncbi:5994_t:CDS:2 [Cetraspora pellucida]|uniref:5994_t:CDS:1 n=1 Tax=Cetraspora pellucida TaxID=1433469 RepID=A0A9N9HHD7_9GLOM|nr:5994_t:CDS:2 [Cetraspora pellucida]